MGITVLFSISFLIVTMTYWIPPVTAFIFQPQASQVDPPTLEPLPTNTFVPNTNVSEEENWKWLEMREHKIMVFVPKDWIADSKQFGWVEGEPPCTEYTLISPDGNGLITITTYCGPFGGESLWNPCGSDPQFVDYARSAVRFQDGDYTFQYSTGAWGTYQGERTILCKWGWLDLPWIYEIHYTQMDWQFKFPTVEKILLSMYAIR